MRTLIALPLLVLALTACKVSTDDANDSVTAEFNQDVLENDLSAAGNTAENIAGDVGNEVEDAANAVENLDVNVEVDTSKAN